MGRENIFHKVLWAVDPFVSDYSLQNTVAKILKVFSRTFSFSIHPVSVVLADQIPYLVGKDSSVETFANQVEAKINGWLSQLALKSIEPVTLRIEPEFSIRSAVRNILTLFEKNSYTVIVASTHAKKRKEGVDLGTFSETLLLLSQAPVFLVPPQFEVPDKFTEIFYPTDLSLNSLATLKSLVPLASALDAEITLFHKMISFAKDIVDFPYSSDARSNYLEQLHDSSASELQKLVTQLQNFGIRSQFIIDRIEADYTSKSIAQHAQSKKGRIIALVSHSTPRTFSLPGSVTRQVVRCTSLPVLILQPEK